MIELTVNIADLTRIQRKLHGLRPPSWMGGVMGTTVAEMRKELAHYPPRGSGPIRWKSERQRRWYHMARRRDGLPLRYARLTDPWSKKLGPSWKTRVRKGGLEGIVQNDSGYAPFVQHDPWQQPFHQDTGWKTAQQVIKNQKSKIERRMAKAAKRIMRG